MEGVGGGGQRGEEMEGGGEEGEREGRERKLEEE